MMEQDERLRIRADLPFAIQQLIITCWDPSPVQRPTFKVCRIKVYALLHVYLFVVVVLSPSVALCLDHLDYCPLYS